MQKKRAYPIELYPNFGMRNKHLTKNTKKRISIALTGKSYPIKLYPNKGMRNKHLSTRAKEKIRVKLEGKCYPAELYPNKGMRNKHHSEKTKKKLRIAMTGKMYSVELYPNHGMRDKHFSEVSKGIIGKSQSEYVKKNPKRSHEQAVRRGRLGGKMGGLAAVRSRREKAPYYFMKVPFDSGDEREVAKSLNSEIEFIPVEGVNCHVRIGSIEIDFKPIEKAFLEYHPWDHNGETNRGYYARRRKILDENGFKDCKLIVVKSFKELAKVIKLIKRMKGQR